MHAGTIHAWRISCALSLLVVLIAVAIPAAAQNVIPPPPVATRWQPVGSSIRHDDPVGPNGGQAE